MTLRKSLFGLLPLMACFLMGCVDTKTESNVSRDVVNMQHELAALIEQMDQKGRFDDLNTTLASIQQQQEALDTQLASIANSLRKSDAAKLVTKNDLEEAIEATKEAVSNAKTGSADCDCMSKLVGLEKRLEELEKRCQVQSLGYSTKSSGSTGSVASSSTYTTQSVSYGPVSYTPTSSGGSTGSLSSVTYSQPVQVQNTTIDLPSETRTVKVVEPRTRRQVTFAEVPENADLGLEVQSTQQCYTDANGNRVCPTAPTASTVSRPTLGTRLGLGSRLFGR